LTNTILCTAMHYGHNIKVTTAPQPGYPMSLIWLHATDCNSTKTSLELNTPMKAEKDMISSWCDHEQGLEVLMENVTSVGFTSCALRHNAKLPDLELAGGPAATGPAQTPLERPPSRGNDI